MRETEQLIPAANEARLLLPPPQAPMEVARRFVADNLVAGDVVILKTWRGSFHRWDGRCWPEADDRRIRSELYHYTEHAYYNDTAGRRPWRPTSTKVANLLDALRAVTYLDRDVQPPVWIGGERPGLEPRDVVVMANGILHLPTRTLHPHDPRLFVTHSVPFDFDPDAPAPTRWLEFVGEIWPDDPDSIALLQEMFGYALSGDTSLQKIMLLVGQPRAGKGVIANTLTHLLGKHNVGAPTLAGLTTNFGLQDLIDRTLAIISDARLGPQTNVQALAERLLSISGEDAITVDRKYRDPWTGRLGVRFLLLTNELPRLSDTSSALAKRFVVLVLKRSFYGKEDPRLLRKLLPELPGILLWALDGLDRLRERGHLVEPDSTRDAVQDLEDLTSPMGAFLRECCDVHVDATVTVDEIWHQCGFHGNPTTHSTAIRPVIPGVFGHP